MTDKMKFEAGRFCINIEFGTRRKFVCSALAEGCQKVWEHVN